MNFKAMFEDQQLFNRQIWKPDNLITPQDQERFMDRLRHLSLGMMEETIEFLRTYEWKSHRRHEGKLANVAHSHEELIDMFKYWLSMADLAGFPMEELEELYYAKSRVVQYRYQEEWLKSIDGPCVVVDIDNVLADYITGICAWAKEYGPSRLGMSTSETFRFVSTINGLKERGAWVTAKSVGLTAMDWSKIKHEFRVQGAKRHLPVFADARPFLDWCRLHNWIILLVTSRPIDRYPNLFTDTLSWLHDNELPFDHLWWATNKADRLEEMPTSDRRHIMFTVDDDPVFVEQYRNRGIRTYHLDRSQKESSSDPTSIRTLLELMHIEEKYLTHRLVST